MHEQHDSHPTQIEIISTGTIWVSASQIEIVLPAADRSLGRSPIHHCRFQANICFGAGVHTGHRIGTENFFRSRLPINGLHNPQLLHCRHIIGVGFIAFSPQLSTLEAELSFALKTEAFRELIIGLGSTVLVASSDSVSLDTVPSK